MPDKQRIMMCAPDHYEVSYVINAWMEGQIGRADRTLAVRQWNDLHAIIARYADIVLQPPQPGLPDLVFTANAGFVIGDIAVVSHFRNTERKGEEKYDHEFFKSAGFKIADWPKDALFEGAGDALLDRGARLIWTAYGLRSDARAATLLGQVYGREVVTLKLVNPHFYHLDTCLCPLTGGYVLYYPDAFDAESRGKIESVVPAGRRIVASKEDAFAFACNAVDLAPRVVMGNASEGLQQALRAKGFDPIVTPLGEFIKAGGSAKCLTLKLVEE
ncbi:MAG: nitrate reductase [Alphaproteobacteria bacterium]|nr:nitrate reductase [Alphaproteobacteria bacterium]